MLPAASVNRKFSRSSSDPKHVTIPDFLAANPTLQIDRVDDAVCRAAGVELRVVRLDLIDAHINGNKWYKLRGNLLAAKQQGITRIVSFGGAWSNHLHALAAAGARFGFETVGIVRGEPAHGLTPTLADAQAFGMQLQFVGRDEYRLRDDGDYLQRIARVFDPCLIVPEGGSNADGIVGCELLAQQLLCHADNGFDLARGSAFNHVVCAAATGGTVAGLARALGGAISLHAVCVLHAADSIRQAVSHALAQSSPVAVGRLNILTGHELGGYAKSSPALQRFIDNFAAGCGIGLEPVYTGKAMHALYSMIERGEFACGTRILFVHTGGLQGRRSSQNAICYNDHNCYNDNNYAATGTAS